MNCKFGIGLVMGLIPLQSTALPKIVVSITIDQLRSDYIEDFMPFYGEGGFKKMLAKGTVYHNAYDDGAPADRAASRASLVTGTYPAYNGITGEKWLDKSTLIPVNCVEDNTVSGLLTNDKSSPKNIATTTVNDELKVATNGEAIIYSIAYDRESAVLSGGHAADGALWFNKNNGRWCSSDYYFKKIPKWIESYNLLYSDDFANYNNNRNVTEMALQCIMSNGMGLDNVTDMLTVTYNAKTEDNKTRNSKQLIQDTYISLDKELEKLTSKIESRFGTSSILFVLTGTGLCDDKEADYAKYRVPSGTFYINRTANLLNMYLSAIYGQDKYIESCFYNQIFLDLKRIEIKRISMTDILSRAQSFLIQNAGVKNVLTTKDLLFSGDNGGSRLRNWYNANNCGDLIIELTPGWKLLNEDNGQQYSSRESIVSFPIIFYGTDCKKQETHEPVSIDRIAPTISKAIRIRAPNACHVPALF